MVIAFIPMANLAEAIGVQSADTDANDLITGANLPMMSGRAERELVAFDAGRRERAVRRLVDGAPDNALLEVAYWAAILEAAEAKLREAGWKAHGDGYTWAAIGWAYGERQAQAAHRKFSARRETT